jgi:Tfp pilus assembly protein PilZ
VSSEARRDRRYRVRIPARLVRGKEVTHLLTEDISYRGVFLRTDKPPGLRQLLRLELALTPSGNEIAVHAMAVFLVPPGAPGDRAAGVGAQFYAMDAVSRRLWDQYIDYVKDRHPESTRAPVMAAPLGSPDPVRRRFERFKAELHVRMDSEQRLHEMLTSDLSLGGMFVRTELDLPIGAEVCLYIVHPRTDVSFPLDCLVRRVVREPGMQGIGVEFMHMTDVMRAEFAAFVKSGLPIASEEEAIFIDESDPSFSK